MPVIYQDNNVGAAETALVDLDTSLPSMPERRAPFELLDYDIRHLLCKWILVQCDRKVLMHFAITSAMFYAPAIRVAVDATSSNPDFLDVQYPRGSFPATSGDALEFSSFRHST
ncbi:hypothetical protein AMAG_10650 [Allomyces macrogynus ATCC 38327]|uniref:Uncharacterized protein n=1 Tax=Allomyces macrogynus (strain ATCC 38327) TaxID=578462 RepID=A0A0L0SR46_ALLM3|nr:hypothetical protein AMAG_10650 [Allomyces macrogynus ATCC 38327]|eukprot:KNE64982.1 hypothetical protein AMAG_10650 [Allomyces macrogynus ATCC 38327]